LASFEELEWDSLPLFLFAAELMRADPELWGAIRGGLAAYPALELLDRMLHPELTLVIVVGSPATAAAAAARQQ
jgi:hypothetical protein